MFKADHVSWSLSELCALLQSEMDRCGIAGLRGRRGRETTLRNIRYYVHVGILDRPAGYDLGEPRFGARHLAQLLTVRALQARGMPLARIRSCIRGLNPKELGAIVDACRKARRTVCARRDSPLPEPHLEVVLEDRGTFLDWLQIYEATALFTTLGVTPAQGVN